VAVGGAQLHLDAVADAEVHRVGYQPDPWRWTPWEYAPFTGRWDDPVQQYRALYLGTSAYACYVEVLACFRPDPAVVAGLVEIDEDPYGPPYPTQPAGVVPAAWAYPRALGEGRLSGRYVDVQHAESIAYLRPTFIGLALAAGLVDFDGSVVRAAEPRSLTGAISRNLYLQDDPVVDGIAFDSRHGNGLGLYAVFERPSTSDVGLGSTTLVDHAAVAAVPTESEEFLGALDLHGLQFEH
jgi:hypothetical protein